MSYTLEAVKHEKLLKELVQLRLAWVRGTFVERVHTEALAMRSRDDLAKVVVMYQEIVKAGVEFLGCNIGWRRKRWRGAPRLRHRDPAQVRCFVEVHGPC